MTLAKAPASRFSSPGASDDGAENPNDESSILEALAGVLLETRDEAMQWRTQSGIEDDWAEDEDFYDARDRANPEGETNVGKPLSPDGGAVNQAVPTGRSSVFIPITRAYVDSSSARVADMLLPNDDAPWKLKATPVPDMGPGQLTPMAAAASGIMGSGPMPMMPQALPGTAQQPLNDTDHPPLNSDPAASASAGMGGSNPGMPAPTQGPAAPAGPGGMPDGQPMPMGVSSMVDAALSEEDRRAERANDVITDWLTECQWHAETRKAIEDAALLGTGILKGPVPTLKRSRKVIRDPVSGSFQVIEEEKIVPVTKRIHPRNFWSDPAGGEDHQAGSYTWELDNIGTRELRKLLRDQSYIHENLLRALREGPGAKNGKDCDQDHIYNIGQTFPMWYFYGDIDKKTMIAAGVPDDMLPEGEDEAVSMAAMVIMVNDHVVKVTPTPLDAGGFPYDIFPWQRRPGLPWGKGVARQMRTPQRMLNAAVRALMDNGGLTSGPLWAIREGWVVGMDGNSTTLTPRKGFRITNKAPPNAKLEDCISFVNIEAATQELELIIDRAKSFAEDATGLPMLMQGQQGDATQTATGMTILNNNGGTVLRRIARTFDDRVTEPHIRRYYFWLLASEGNDNAKGDFQIDARGSTYLVDRELYAQHLNQLYPLLAQSRDIHPGRLAEEVAAANRLPIKRIFLTDAEKKIRDQQPIPKPIQVQVAEIRAGSTESVQQMILAQKDPIDQGKLKVAEGQLQQTMEHGLADIASRMGISDDQLKTMLTVELMRHHSKLAQGQQQAAVGAQQAGAQNAHDDTQAGIDRAHERTTAIEQRDHESAMQPPAETPGKAPAGHAYEA